jgi:hypothetical protein
MRERRSEIVLLIRAFEESDSDGVILPVRARAVATRRALRVTGLTDWGGDLQAAHNLRNGETVMRRSRLLFDSLAHKLPALRGLLHVARLGMSTVPAVVGAAFLLGLSSNALAPNHRLNLLSFPFLGMLAWNLMVYVGLLTAPVFKGRLKRGAGRMKAGGRGVAGYLADWLLRSAIWRRLRGWRRREGDHPARLRIITRSIVRFGALWQRCAKELLAARVRRLLHVAALTLALGMLGGMYLRGVTLEYRATWESTWLGTQQVQFVMNTVLGPAAAVSGSEVPDVGPLHAPANGDAAPWIHLYALTVLLAVVLPRLLLALFEGLRSARLAADVPIDLEDGYFRRLFREWRGDTTSVEIVPYSFEPETESVERLKSWLRDYFGARADICMRAPLAYGDGSRELFSTATGDGPWKQPRDVGDDLEDSQVTHCHVILFNLSQTPEPEVHGQFLEDLKARADSSSDSLLVVVDSRAFSRRVAVRSRKRERMRAWQRIAQQARLDLVELDAASADEEPSLRKLSQAIWPREKPATTGSEA